MKRKAWRNKETEISLQIGEDVYEIMARHSGYIEPESFGLPEDSLPEEVEIEIHWLIGGRKNNQEMTNDELDYFLEKYDGMIGDEILSKILD